MGGIVAPADLVGRGEIIADMTAALKAGQNLLLAEPRRMGKTSVVYEVLRRFSLEGYLTAMVDVSACSAQSFPEALLAEIAPKAKGFPRFAELVKKWLADRAFVLKLKLPGDLQQEVELAAELVRPEGVQTPSLSGALDFIEQLAVRRGSRAIIALDEFQAARKFNRKGEADVFAVMRSRIIRQEQVSYIFLGSQAGLISSLFMKENEPFYRLALKKNLPSIPPEEWVEYLNQKFRGLGTDASEITRSLVSRAGGHPMDVMLLASTVQVLAERTGTRFMLPTLLDAAYAEALQSLASGSFSGLWSRLAREQQIVLTHLAHNKPPYRPEVNTNLTRPALNRLVEDGLLVRPARGDYRFVEAMFRDWVTSTQPDMG